MMPCSHPPRHLPSSSPIPSSSSSSPSLSTSSPTLAGSGCCYHVLSSRPFAPSLASSHVDARTLLQRLRQLYGVRQDGSGEKIQCAQAAEDAEAQRLAVLRSHREQPTEEERRYQVEPLRKCGGRARAAAHPQLVPVPASAPLPVPNGCCVDSVDCSAAVGVVSGAVSPVTSSVELRPPFILFIQGNRRDRAKQRRNCSLRFLFDVEQLREWLHLEPDAVGGYRTGDFLPEGLPPPPLLDALSLLCRAMEMAKGVDQSRTDQRHPAAVFQQARRVDQSEEELEWHHSRERAAQEERVGQREALQRLSLSEAEQETIQRLMAQLSPSRQSRSSPPPAPVRKAPKTGCAHHPPPSPLFQPFHHLSPVCSSHPALRC